MIGVSKSFLLNSYSIKQYNFSFTGVYLMYNACLKLADCYRGSLDWEYVKQWALTENILQARREATSKKRVRILVERLKLINHHEWQIFFKHGSDSKKQLIFLALVRFHPIFYEFLIEIVREKHLTFDSLLLKSDFEFFWNQKAIFSDKIASIKYSTQKKIAYAIFHIMSEAGWIEKRCDIGYHILPNYLHQELVVAIIQSDPNWLNIFLKSDREINDYLANYVSNFS